MRGDVYCRMSKKQKFLGILIVCLIFICLTVTCLIRQKNTNVYNFNLKELELKTSVYDDGIIRSDHAADDFFCATRPFILPTGGYTIWITYASDAPGSVLVQGNNDCVFDIQLPSTGGRLETVTDERLILPQGTDKGKLKFYQTGEGTITVNRINIGSYRHLYMDYYAIIGIAFLLSIGIIYIILIFNRLNLTRTGLSYVGLFIIVAVLVNIPFCMFGTYYEIDTQGHMKRIEAIAQGIRDGQFPVIIGPNYANQYGELIALQPGLFLYIPALMRLVGVSVPTAYNIFMIMINMATAVVAFVCAVRMFNTIRWAMIAAVFYLIEPFRLFVMLELGAGAGMGIAMVFLPFLIVGLHETMNKKGARWKYITVGLWGLACSHVMGLALSGAAMFLYILFHIKKLLNKEVFIALAKAAVMFVILSAGVWIPFLGYYFSDWNRSALAWTDFYNTAVEWKREVLNIIALIVLGISYFGVRRTGHLTKFGKGIFTMGFCFIVLSLQIFPWFLFKNVPIVDTFLSMMQYRLRFHFMAVPYISYAAAEAVCSNMDSRTKIRKKVMYSVVGLLGAGLILCSWDFYNRSRLFKDMVAGEINTIMEDYLPDGTQSEWYETDTGDFSDYDEVEAFSYSKVNTHIECSYIAHSEGQYMEFPLFYYEGYTAYDGNGLPLKVEKGLKNRVRVYLTCSNEVQQLHVRFVVKRMYTIVFTCSLIIGTIWLAFNVVELIYKAVKSKRVIV